MFLLELSIIISISAVIFNVLSFFKNRYFNVFKYIFITHLGLFGLLTSYAIYYSLGLNANTLLLDFLTKFGILAGHVGIFFWFVAIEKLELDDSQIHNNLIIKFIYAVVGMSFILNFFYVGQKFDVATHSWIFYFQNEYAFLLLILAYGLLFFHMLLFFYRRTRYYMFKDRFPTKLAFTFVITLLTSIVFFVLGNFLMISNAYWIFFGSIGILVLSYLQIRLPAIMLTNEQPSFFLLFTNEGSVIYSKSFIENFISINDALFSGYLSALNIIGERVMSERSSVKKIKYGSLNVLLLAKESLQLCYIYKGSSFYSDFRLQSFTDRLQKNPLIWDDLSESIQQRKKMVLTNELDHLISDHFRI